MADDTLPIVFRARPTTGFGMMALGVFIAAAGIAKAADDSFSHADDHFGPFTFSSQTTGWLMIAVGLPVAIVALVMLVRGCPRLTLDDAGLTLARCFGNPVQVPWNRLVDVVVRGRLAPSLRRTTTVDVLYLVTDEGRQVDVVGIGKPQPIAETIRRVAARRKRA